MRLTGSQVGNRYAGGLVANLGTVYVYDSQLEASKALFGGALYNYGTAYLERVSFANNNAQIGGAISNSGTLTATCTNFEGNRAEYGGAIRQEGDSATLLVNFSRFRGNVANPWGRGAIHVDSGLSANASNNWWGAAPTNTTPEVDDGYYGVDRVDSVSATVITLPLAETDPLLSETCAPALPLPIPAGTSTPSYTPTETLTPTETWTPSPSLTPTETLMPSLTFTPSTTPTFARTDVPSNAGFVVIGAGDSLGLINAINEANARSNGESAYDIYLQGGTYSFDGTTTDLPDITGKLRLFGTNNSRITFTGEDALVIGSTANVELHHAYLTNVVGSSRAFGGTVHNQGRLKIVDSTIEDAVVAVSGAAILNYGETWMPRDLTLLRVTLRSNETQYGGGIWNNGSVTATCVSFEDNVANFGAALYNDVNAGTVTISKSAFTGNIGVGGAIFNESATPINAADNWWGTGIDPVIDGVASGTDTITVGVNIAPVVSTNPLLTDPTCQGLSAIAPPTLTPTPTFTPSLTPSFTATPTFARTDVPSSAGFVLIGAGDSLGLINAINEANRRGLAPPGYDIYLQGGIYRFDGGATDLPAITGRLRLFGSNNSQLTFGGEDALVVKVLAIVELRNLYLTAGVGRSPSAGPLIDNEEGRLRIFDSTVENVVATAPGVAIKNYGATGGIHLLSLVRVTLRGNNAPYGAGVWNNGAFFGSCVLFENNSASFGGALYNVGGSVTISKSAFIGNTGVGGAIFNESGTTSINASDNFWDRGNTPVIDSVNSGRDTITARVNIAPVRTTNPLLNDPECVPQLPATITATPTASNTSTPSLTPTPSLTLPPPFLGQGTGLLAAYYNGEGLNSLVATRLEPIVNFNYSNWILPAGVNGSQFSARLSGFVQPKYSDDYTFGLYVDDGIRVWFNNQLVLDNYVGLFVGTRIFSVNSLTAGTQYPITIEYLNGGGGASLQLYWKSIIQPNYEIVPTTYLYPPSPSTATPTPSLTRTTTQTSSATRTLTPSETATATSTFTQTWTPTFTDTPSPTFTPSLTLTPSETFTATATPTETLTPSITFTPSLTTTPGPASGVSTTFELTPSRGKPGDTLSLTVTARDALGRAMPNANIGLSSTNPSLQIAPANGITDVDGRFTAQVTSATITSGVIDVTIDGVRIGSKIVSFVGGDVAVSVVGVPQIVAGQNLLYTIRVTNAGLLPAQNVSVVAGLPFGVSTFESADITPTTQSGNQATWVISRLKPAEVRLIHVVGRSYPNISAGTALVFGALVATTPDADSSNNEALFQTQVALPSAPTVAAQAEKLSVTYSPTVAGGSIGETVNLKVVVRNTSTEPVYNLEGFARLRGAYPVLTFTWPNTAFKGRLLPNETAEAQFPYTIGANLLDLLAVGEPAWVKAVDGTPEDGAAVAVSSTLTGLTLNGPLVRLSAVSNKTTAAVGETITYTVVVENDSRSNDGAILIVRDTLTGVTHPLTPGNPLIPGQSATSAFDYVVTTADVGTLTNWISLQATGVLYPSATVTLNSRVLVTAAQPISSTPVATPNPGNTLNLSIDTSSAGTTLLQGQSRSIPLIVGKAGAGTIGNLTVRLSLPPGLEVLDAAGGTYTASAQRIVWTYTALTNGVAVAPVIRSTEALGTVLNLDVALITDAVETSTADNTASLALTVQAQIPSVAAADFTVVEGADRAYIIADGRDSIRLQVVVKDQLANVMPNVAVTFSSPVAGLSFSPTSVTTDAMGKAVVTLLTTATTDAGPAAIEALLNGASSASRGITVRSNPIALTQNQLNVGVGGTVSTTVNVSNTFASSAIFDLAVTGLPAPVASWISVTPAALPIGFGRFAEAKLTVTVPAGQCAAAGDYPYTLTATGQGLGLLGEAKGTVRISATPPQVSEAVPAPNARVGNAAVLFGWRSNTPGTNTVFYRVKGATTYQQATLTGNANDATAYSIVVTLTQGEYEWYGVTSTACGESLVASATAPRTLVVAQSVTFVNRAYTFTIRDDYNQTVDANGNPLTISIRNDDTVAHDVSVSVGNPYSDLIVGFTGSGSIDSAVRLQPGASFALPLRVFTQAIEGEQYALTLNLTTDNATDAIPLNLTVLRPDPANVAYTILSTDPTTLETVAQLTNNGPTITDLDFEIVQAGTGIPANFVIEPDLHHVYLKAGERIQFKIIPLELAGQTTLTAQNGNGTTLRMSNPGTDPRVVRAAVEGPFEAEVKTGGKKLKISNAASNVCGTGSNAYSKVFETPITVTAKSAGWYCTNRPDVEFLLRAPIPFDAAAKVTGVTLRANLNPGDGAQYNHALTVGFNGAILGTYNVSGPGTLTTSVDLANWAYVENAPAYRVNGTGLNIPLGSQPQKISFNARFYNDAHYVILSDVEMDITLDSFSCNVCAANAAGAEAICRARVLQQNKKYLYVACTQPNGLKLRPSVNKNESNPDEPNLDDEKFIVTVPKGAEVEDLSDSTNHPNGVEKVDIRWKWVRYTDGNGKTYVGWIGYENLVSKSQLLSTTNDCPPATPTPAPSPTPAASLTASPTCSAQSVNNKVLVNLPDNIIYGFVSLDRARTFATGLTGQGDVIGTEEFVTRLAEGLEVSDEYKFVAPSSSLTYQKADYLEIVGRDNLNPLIVLVDVTLTSNPTGAKKRVWIYSGYGLKTDNCFSNTIPVVTVTPTLSTVSTVVPTATPGQRTLTTGALCATETVPWKKDLCNKAVGYLSDSEFTLLQSSLSVLLNSDFIATDRWWLDNIGRSLQDVPPTLWGTFDPAQCHGDAFCLAYGLSIVNDSVFLFNHMNRIGIDLLAVGDGQKIPTWLDPTAIAILNPNINLAVYACTNASVCWVCQDLPTQLYLRAGYDLRSRMLLDNSIREKMIVQDPPAYKLAALDRNVVPVAEFLTNSNRLFSGNTTPYRVGDMVFLKDNVAIDLPGYFYHVGVVVRGQSSSASTIDQILDEVLIAQNSYTSQGFYMSKTDSGIGQTIGKFEVITLRTYLNKASGNTGSQSPAISNYLAHGIPLK